MRISICAWAENEVPHRLKARPTKARLLRLEAGDEIAAAAGILEEEEEAK